MEKKYKAIQVYTIIICVISVITIIISLSSLVSAIIDKGDPIHANRHEISLSSFENFKMNSLKSVTKDQAFIPDNQELLKMYEDAKADKISTVKHQTNRTIIVSSIIIIISILFFTTHLWVMRKIGRQRFIE